MRKAVCGFANGIGGYLIVGAEYDGGSWSLPGARFATEPRTWLSSVITSGLRRVPTFDVHAWEIASDRHVAVIAVDELAVRPCITADGSVYVRTSGQTLPVTDPVELAGLFDSGERARQRAIQAARERIAVSAGPHPHAIEQFELLKFALSTTRIPESLELRLFSREFATQTFIEVLKPHLHVGPIVHRVWQYDVLRDGLKAGYWGEDTTWAATATLDGVAALVYTSRSLEAGIDSLMNVISGAWNAGADLASALKLAPPFFLAFEAFPGRESIREDRWVGGERPSDDDLASIRRRIQRAQGLPAWEPAPD